MPKKRKVHSLTGRIDLRLMHHAFKAVKQNRGAAGIDKVSITMFAANLEENLAALMKDLKAGTFRPRPLRRKMIPKGPGTTKLRPLGIPVVRDRVAQEVIRRLLAPIFEPQFHDASFGFRPKRNCHQAIERVLEFHEQGDRVVLDADISGFFDNIPHRVIMAAIAAEVADGNILRLVEKFLTAGVMENGVFKPTTVGTPQGGVVSPLLANIVLNHLDWKLHEEGYRFVRYADDFVVACQTKQQAQEARTLVEQVLETDLGLSLSPDKTEITTYGKGYEFLGFFLSSRSRRMRDKSVQKFQGKSAGTHHSETQPGPKRRYETQPGYQRYGPVLRHHVFDQSLELPETGLVDSDAASLYEARPEKLQRQSQTACRLLPPQTWIANAGRILHLPRSAWQSTSRDSSTWGNFNWGRPVRDPHAGKYEETTSLRQRGGSGWQPQPPLYPLTLMSCRQDG